MFDFVLILQENVDELEDEVRIQKEEYEDLDHSYDRSMQYQSSVVTERDELKKQMEEIKAAKRRRGRSCREPETCFMF